MITCRFFLRSLMEWSLSSVAPLSLRPVDWPLAIIRGWAHALALWNGDP